MKKLMTGVSVGLCLLALSTNVSPVAAQDARAERADQVIANLESRGVDIAKLEQRLSDRGAQGDQLRSKLEANGVDPSVLKQRLESHRQVTKTVRKVNRRDAAASNIQNVASRPGVQAKQNVNQAQRQSDFRQDRRMDRQEALYEAGFSAESFREQVEAGNVSREDIRSTTNDYRLNRRAEMQSSIQDRSNSGSYSDFREQVTSGEMSRADARARFREARQSRR